MCVCVCVERASHAASARHRQAGCLLHVCTSGHGCLMPVNVPLLWFTALVVLRQHYCHVWQPVLLCCCAQPTCHQVGDAGRHAAAADVHVHFKVVWALHEAGCGGWGWRRTQHVWLGSLPPDVASRRNVMRQANSCKAASACCLLQCCTRLLGTLRLGAARAPAGNWRWAAADAVPGYARSACRPAASPAHTWWSVSAPG